MRILALVTARGGSKRLPGKNVRVLAGRPLIVWSIDSARGIPEICEILVSTDDPTIAAVCSDAGAFVPWLRPPELATDMASSVEVALHALDWYEGEKGEVDGLLLLQPTSPFRTKETIRRGIDCFRKHCGLPVLGVSPSDVHPKWMLKMEGDYLAPFIPEHGLEVRSQDLPPVYVVNGGFYLISPTQLRARRSFVGPKTIPLLIESPEESLDIDNEWDWAIACNIAANMVRRSPIT